MNQTTTYTATASTPPLNKEVRKERDLSMDFLKGFACVLMVIAHAPLIFPDTPLAGLIRMAIGPLTAVFFGTAAEAALLQRKSYGLKPTILIYVWLFFLGANMSPLMQHFELYDHVKIIEMLSIIALGCLLVLLLDEYLKPNRWGYLAVALGIVALKFALDYFGSDIDWPQFFAINKGSVEYLPNGNAKVYPGFAMIPWLAVFPFVIFVRKSSILSNLIVSSLCSAAVIILILTGVISDIQLDIFNKWDQTPGWILMAGALNSFVFAIFAPNEAVLPFKPKWVINLGRNSLAFLYAHIFGIVFGWILIMFLLNDNSPIFKSIPYMYVIRQYLFWVIAISLSLLITFVIGKIPPLSIFKKYPAWIALLFLIYAVPFVITGNPIFNWISWIIEYTFGILIVANFPYLVGRLRN